MTASAAAKVSFVESRENSLVKQLRQLSLHGTAYRKLGRFWVEGEHLCRAAVDRGLVPAVAVFSASTWPTAPPVWVGLAARVVILPDAVFDEVSGLESGGGFGFLIDSSKQQAPRPGLASVVLDRVQDPGNVGSILRSAAAFGFQQVLSLKGGAALWAQKVLRAGMGAHFALNLVEELEVTTVLELGLPLIVTSSHHGKLVHQQELPWPCVWAFGHEGQGLCEALFSHAGFCVRIGQPGGEESLNVAAAAAICMHASASTHA